MATFTVDNVGDVVDGNYAAGQQTLREAIMRANALAGNDIIDFALPDGTTITLSLDTNMPPDGEVNELVVTSNIEFRGNVDADTTDQDIIIDANGTNRVFLFTNSSTDSSIDGMTITGGNIAGDGGGITNGGAANGKGEDVHGAGILNEGSLTITNSLITGNSAGGGGAGAPSTGGGGGFGGQSGSIGGNGPSGGYGGAGQMGGMNFGGDGGDNAGGGDKNNTGGNGGTYASGGGSGGTAATGGQSGAGAGGAGGTAFLAGVGRAGGGGGGGGYSTSGQDGGFGGSASGGIFNSGTLLLYDSTVTNNIAAGGGGGGAAGGVTGIGGDGGNAGGGVYNASAGVFNLDAASYAALTGNVASSGAGGGGGNAGPSGSAGTAANNIYGAFTVLGLPETLTVTTSADELFGGAETVAAPDGTGLSLREAIGLADPNDTITFDMTVFDGQPADVITLINGTLLLPLGTSLIIEGDLGGATGVTISGNDAATIFTVADGANVTLADLTLTNGAATGTAGAAGPNGANGGGSSAGGSGTAGGTGGDAGGAIDNSGTLTVSNTAIQNSMATGGTGGSGGNGGTGGTSGGANGVGYSGGVGGIGGDGGNAAGGILNRASGSLTLTSVTFSGNNAVGGAGGNGGDGGEGGDGVGTGFAGTGFGGGAGGLGGSASASLVNLGGLAGSASDGGGNTQTAGIGGAGGAGGDGGSNGGGAPADTPGTGGAGGPANTMGTGGTASSPLGNAGGAGGPPNQPGFGGTNGDGNSGAGGGGGGGGGGGPGQSAFSLDLANPEIAVLGNNQNIADGDTTPDTSDDTDFGTIEIAAGSDMHAFTVRNLGLPTLAGPGGVGNITATITGTNAADFAFGGLGQGPISLGTLELNESQIFNITFDPSAGGMREATVTINSNDGDENPFTFDIEGFGGTAPEIAVEGNSTDISDGDTTPSVADDTDFGDVFIASGSDTHTFTIDNEGSEALDITSITITGTHSADFTLMNVTTGAITVGGSTTFDVVFDPSAEGARDATVSIANDDPNENPFTFDITGNGVDPEIDVEGQAMSIPDGDTTPQFLDDTDFGALSVAGGTDTHTFTIQNEGSGNLNVSAITVTGTHAAEFTLMGFTPGNIAPAGDTSFMIEFDPSGGGLREATVSITNTDTDENPYTFDIRGTGTAPEITVGGMMMNILDGDTTPDTADGTDFGTAIEPGDMVTNSFTIINDGNESLNVTSVTVTGTHAADFTLMNVTTGMITVGGSTTFDVEFDPSAIGDRDATIEIASNDADEATFNFDITGEGIPPAPDINVQGQGMDIPDGDTTPQLADDTDFGDVLEDGGSDANTFTIQNQGGLNLDITSVTVTGTHASDFVVTDAPDATVTAGGTTTLDVTFNPSALGLREATVTVASNDPDEASYDFDIQGTGTETPSLVVTTDQDVVDDSDGETSLREAIGHINAGTFAPGSTITFAAGPGQAFEGGGTIFLDPTLDDFFISESMIIDGDLDDDMIPDIDISADTSEGAGDADSRIITFDSFSDDKSLTLMGLTVRDGDAGGGRGGGIFAGTGETLTIFGSSVRNNESADNGSISGGGIYIGTGGALTIVDTAVADNDATGDGDGGGIALESATLVAVRSQITGNVAEDANMTSSTDAGGIRANNSSTIVLLNTTVANNATDDDGGGLYLDDDTSLLAISSTFSGNRADTGVANSGFGGAIYADEDNSVTLINSTVHGNFGGDGGGIYVGANSGMGFNATLTVINSTITGNYSNEKGGGIYAKESAQVTIANSIVAGNSSATGADDLDAQDATAVLMADGDNVIGSAPGGFGEDISGNSTTIDGTSATDLGNVFASLATIDPDGMPANADDFLAGALASNGGYTQTVALALTLANPALDASDTSIAIGLSEAALGIDINGDGDMADVFATVGDLEFDQRGPGFPRDIDQPVGGTPDLGAFEAEEVQVPPMAMDDMGMVSEDGPPVQIDLTSNDKDGNLDNLEIVSIDTTGLLGTATVQPDNDLVLYDPAGMFEALAVGEMAEDVFTYVVTDGQDTDTATVTVKVLGVNDAPMAVDDSAATDPMSPILADVLANDLDPDASDVLTINALDTSLTAGMASIVPGGISYDPTGAFPGLAPGETAMDVVSYEISDGNGGIDVAKLTVLVTAPGDGGGGGGNAAPFAADDSAMTGEAGPVVMIPLLANDTDPDGDPLTVTGIDTSLTQGSAVLGAGGVLSYNPAGVFDGLFQGETAVDEVAYTISDGNGGTAMAMARITVKGAGLPPNQPPVARDDAFATAPGVPVSGNLFADNGMGTDSDPDGDPLAIQAINGEPGDVEAATLLPSGALLTANADGSFDYDPNGAFGDLGPGEAATDSFVYTLSDGKGGSDTAIVNIAVDAADFQVLPGADGSDPGDNAFEVENFDTPLIVDGGEGNDSVDLPGDLDDFVIVPIDGGFEFQPIGGGQPVRVFDIEEIGLDDATLFVDTSIEAQCAFFLYQTFLDRDPDPFGLAFWADLLDAGLSLDAAADFFEASPEHQALVGEVSNAEYVDTIYLFAFNRESDDAGSAFWTALLDEGTLDRGDAGLFFAKSAEMLDVFANEIDDGLLLAG